MKEDYLKCPKCGHQLAVPQQEKPKDDLPVIRFMDDGRHTTWAYVEKLNEVISACHRAGIAREE